MTFQILKYAVLRYGKRPGGYLMKLHKIIAVTAHVFRHLIQGAEMPVGGAGQTPEVVKHEIVHVLTICYEIWSLMSGRRSEWWP